VGWSAVYAATDLWLIILPIRIVSKLKLPMRKKLGVIFIFLLGCFATVFAILKLAVIKRTYTSYDPNWYFIWILIFTQLELCIGLIAASLPALGFLLIRLIPSKPNSEETRWNTRSLLSAISATFRFRFGSKSPPKNYTRGVKDGSDAESATSEKAYNAHEEVARDRIITLMAQNDIPYQPPPTRLNRFENRRSNYVNKDPHHISHLVSDSSADSPQAFKDRPPPKLNSDSSRGDEGYHSNSTEEQQARPSLGRHNYFSSRSTTLGQSHSRSHGRHTSEPGYFNEKDEDDEEEAARTPWGKSASSLSLPIQLPSARL